MVGAMPRLHASLLFSEPDLQLARVTCDGHDGPRVKEESTESERLVLALHGRFQYRDARARAVVGPGTGLLLRPHQPCEISHPHGGGDACLSVRGTWVRRWLDPGRATFSVSVDAYLRLQASLAGAGLGRVAVEEALCLALSPSGPPEPGRRLAARERSIAEAVAHAAALRFDEGVSVEALALDAGVSVFHACRVFRRVMGTSIHAHVQELRLRHALALVLDTRLPLAEVALEAGFANQGHLGNAFRRRFGRTPGAVRKGHRPPS